MNRRSLIPFLLLAAGCSGRSAEPPASTASAAPATTMAASPSPMGPTIEAEVVTMDAAAPSLTLREGDVPGGRAPRATDLKAGDRTIRVETAAASSLSALKPGIRVRVTCSAPVAVVTGNSMGAASPGMAPSPAAGSGAMASPGMAGGASPASAGMTGGTMAGGTMAGGSGMLAQCDSILSVTALESAPSPQ